MLAFLINLCQRVIGMLGEMLKFQTSHWTVMEAMLLMSLMQLTLRQRYSSLALLCHVEGATWQFSFLIYSLFNGAELIISIQYV